MPETMTTINLVKHYFNICNIALVEHSRNPIYKAVVALIEQFAGGDNIGIKVLDEKGKPHGYFTTYFKEGQFAPITEGTHEPDKALTVSESFLREVVDHRDDYISHPHKLDWNWLTK